MRFCYVAQGADGARRGTLEAPSEREAWQQLGERGLTVVRLTQERMTVQAALRFLDGLVSWWWLSQARLEVYRIVAQFVRHGQTPLRGWIAARGAAGNRRMSEAVDSIVAGMQLRGQAMSAGMAARPHEFPPLHAALVRIGEESDMARIYDALVSLEERRKVSRNKVERVLIGPGLLFMGIIVYVIVLGTTLMPKFEATIGILTHGEKLPEVEFFEMASGLLGSPWFITACVASVLLGVEVFRRLGKIDSLTDFGERVRLRLPLFGPLYRKAILADFCFLMEVTLGFLKPSDCFRLLSDGGLGSHPFEAGLRRAADAVASGEESSIKGSLAICGLFPRPFLEIIGASEHDPRDTFRRLARDYAMEVETSSELGGNVAQVAAIVATGAVLALVVMLTYGALFRVMPKLLNPGS